MNCQHRIVTISCVATLLLDGWVIATTEKPIVNTNNASLTTYLVASKTPVQDARPLAIQRGVNLDGTNRDRSPFAWTFSGNRVQDENGSLPMPAIGGVDLSTGGFTTVDIDLSLPSPGAPWHIGRSYNALQDDGNGQYDSNGIQGYNWFQISQMEIQLHTGETSADDVLYLIYGAGAYIEFPRADATGGGASLHTFQAANGAGGAFKWVAGSSGEPDIWTYTDQRGNRFKFFGFDNDAGQAAGQIWRIIAPNGMETYAGDKTTASTAISNGFWSNSGRLKYVYQELDNSATRRYYYEYDGNNRLTDVTVAVKPSGGSYSNTGHTVEYQYYDSSANNGRAGDLELVTVTTPMSDSGITSVKKKHYRYWTSPADKFHTIKYIMDFEGTRRYDWEDLSDPRFDDGFLNASDDDIKTYAAAYFDYYTGGNKKKVKEAWFSGACGCAGGTGSGTYKFDYDENTSFSGTAGYDQGWRWRSVVEQPDGSWLSQYVDEVGQPLHSVITDGDPASSPENTWVTKVARSASGQITSIHSPANVSGYTHAVSTWEIELDQYSGLVLVFTQVASGDAKGFLKDVKHKEGTTGLAYLDRSLEYTSTSVTVGDVSVVRPLLSSTRVYPVAITSGTSGSVLTQFSYAHYSGDDALRVKSTTTTYPAVTTGNNGSGDTTSEIAYLRKDGTTAFHKAADGIFTYTQHEDGLLKKRIDDADTTASYPSGDDPNNDFGITENEGEDGVHRVTEFTYDEHGRLDQTDQPDGRVLKEYWSVLGDRRIVRLKYPDYGTSPETFYGPIHYAIYGLNGARAIVSVVALDSTTTAQTGHVDESESDPIDAMLIGSVARFTESTYDDTGTRVEETRVYYDIANSYYDVTELGYDNTGRRWRVKDATGTIHRTVYDSIGRPVEEWMGTNDSTFDGGEPTGSDTMVKTSVTEYDAANDGGNSYVTKQTLFVENSTTDQRVTEFEHDARGLVLLQTNPAEPKHILNLYDNMGRLLAEGTYSAGDGSDDVEAGDDPTSRSDDRLALTEYAYDELGRMWRVKEHEIDVSDGSDDDNLETLNWFDELGRLVKVDGELLQKHSYDRLGRSTHTFLLANHNDTSYADRKTVSGDIVLEEWQTVYESTDSDDVWMSAVIERHHDDHGTGENTGALDENADGGTPDPLKYTAADIAGRIQITANWYDRLGRVTDTVEYGTNGGSTFDRDPVGGLSVPARSDDALLTEYEYNTDGSLAATVDPRNLETRREYDDAGRLTKLVRNYDDGTPGGTTGDEDQTVTYEYTNGLRTKLTADLPSGSTDQVTTYTYGVAASQAPASKITVNNLLYKITYPDSGEVVFAYNAQAEEITRKDPIENVFQTDRDVAGRVTHERVVTLNSEDGLVRRISRTYDALGRVENVTQYDDDTVGAPDTVVNDVEFSYDGWGNISKIQQDRNSAVGASGSVDDYEVSFAYLKATSGRNTIRRSSMTYPDSNVISYIYEPAGVGSLHDAEAVRVTTVKDGTVELARYDYNGLGTLVGTTYNEPDIMWKMYSSSSYPDLDRFNRVTSSRWTKDLATDRDFYDVDVTYDRNSNVIRTVDNIYDNLAGTPKHLFDVDHTLDDLDRLTQAKEGHWSGAVIESGTETRDQQWTLDQVGNWDQVKLDLDGDLNYNECGPGEYDDDRTHNNVNELTQRDISVCTSTYNLGYNANGQLTDDGQHYKYEYDAFGRLRKVKNRSTNALVVQHWYNGLGYRISTHYDTDGQNGVDSNDTKFHFAYDERWRIVSVFEDDDSDPVEQFVYDNAGLGGFGGSSVLDAVVLRDRDADKDQQHTLEERVYYCQNWRNDVVALVTDDGKHVEQVRYSAYGIPYGIPKADVDGDGDVDSTDRNQISSWSGVSYDVRGDLNLDGTVNLTDVSAANSANGAGGWKVPSDSANGNRIGYAGYELDVAVLANYATYHVRHRVLSGEFGRWLQRDPLEYADGMNLYIYGDSNPVATIDPMGLAASSGRKPIVAGTQGLCLCGTWCRGAFWECRCQPPGTCEGCESNEGNAGGGLGTGDCPGCTFFAGASSQNEKTSGFVAFQQGPNNPTLIDPDVDPIGYWRKRAQLCNTWAWNCHRACEANARRCKLAAIGLTGGLGVLGDGVAAVGLVYPAMALGCVGGGLIIIGTAALVGGIVYATCAIDESQCHRYCDCKQKECWLDLNPTVGCGSQGPPGLPPPNFPPGYPYR